MPENLTLGQALTAIKDGLTKTLKDHEERKVKAFEQKCLQLRKAELEREQRLQKSECTGDALCKCEKCEGQSSYAKGEMDMEKSTNPLIAARMIANKAKAKQAPKPATPPAPAPVNKMQLPGEIAHPTSPEPSTPVNKAQVHPDSGNGPTSMAPPPPPTPVGKAELDKSTNPAIIARMAANKAKAKQAPKPPAPAPEVKKAGLGMGAPKAPGAGATASPTLPAPKVAAPAKPAKTPALGAGTPQMKTELNKAGLINAQKSPHIADVRQSVGNTMDNMLAGGQGLNPGQPLSITPIASNPLKPVGARSDVGGGGPAPMVAKGPVKTLVERAAGRMPAGGAGNLTPPPSGARVALPGQHLFGGGAPKAK